MILMNKVEITAYRYLGCVGSCFTLCQSIIWLMLAMGAAFCKFAKCGSEGSKRTFKYCFYLMYYYEPENATANFTRMNYINPTSFHALMWVNILLYIGNIVISVFMAKAFIQWIDAKAIKKTGQIWAICILVFSGCELITSIIFASDMVSVKGSEDIKCIMEMNISLFKSSHLIERRPAPFLLQLKSDLKTMKKKIRKYKKNLQFLDAVFDEENPDHVKNPFISKNVVNTYVEDIWRTMFNTSIRGTKVRRKTDESIPFDEVMKNFVISKHLELDDIDYDLLKNFDGLTNNKWIKPIRSSNMVFGRQFNLTSRMTEDESTELDQLASLLQEYLRNTETPLLTNETQPVVDLDFDALFKEILDELEAQETHFEHDKEGNDADILANRNNDALIISKNNEDTMLSLRKMIEGQNEQEINDQDMQNVVNQIKEFLDQKKNIQLSDGEILNIIKESLKYEFELNKAAAADAEDADDGDQAMLSNNSRQLNLAPTHQASNKSFLNVSRRANRLKPLIQRKGDSSESESSEYESDGSDGSSSSDEPQPKPKPKPKPPPPKPKTTPKPVKKTYRNDLIEEICENCAYFVLGPSIVCTVLAIKTGLVWILNITVAILLLYYGSRVKLKTKFKLFPCLSKKN